MTGTPSRRRKEPRTSGSSVCRQTWPPTSLGPPAPSRQNWVRAREGRERRAAASQQPGSSRPGPGRGRPAPVSTGTGTQYRVPGKRSLPYLTRLAEKRERVARWAGRSSSTGRE